MICLLHIFVRMYRYIIYKLYFWALKRPNDTPVFNVIVTLAFVHFTQLLTIYLYAFNFFDFKDILTTENIKYIVVFFIFFVLLHYLILYNGKKWDGYILQFQNEDKRNRKKNSMLVLLYLIGSIIFFFVSLPLVFGW